MAVIPRLRAMRPVRIESGVHLVDVTEELGFTVRAHAMRVVLNCRHCERSCHGLGASTQRLSMVENNLDPVALLKENVVGGRSFISTLIYIITESRNLKLIITCTLVTCTL
jgi:hypothetical protein